MLSNDNEEGGNPDTMELSEEVITTPTTHIAVTPAASLKPLAQSRSDDPTSDDTIMFKMAVMTDKYNYPRMTEVNEESK